MVEVLEAYKSVFVLVGFLHDSAELFVRWLNTHLTHCLTELVFGDDTVCIAIKLLISFIQLFPSRALYFSEHQNQKLFEVYRSVSIEIDLLY
jgi:hypothetical protein